MADVGITSRVNLRAFVDLEVVIARAVTPAVAEGPLAGTVMAQLAAWLESEDYAGTVVPRIPGVARGLSSWMADNNGSCRDLNTGFLKAFEASYGPGVPGHASASSMSAAVRVDDYCECITLK